MPIGQSLTEASCYKYLRSSPQQPTWSTVSPRFTTPSVPQDKKAFPSIVVTSSILPQHPVPQFFTLSLVKAAQRNLVQSLSLTYASQRTIWVSSMLVAKSRRNTRPGTPPTLLQSRGIGLTSPERSLPSRY